MPGSRDAAHRSLAWRNISRTISFRTCGTGATPITSSAWRRIWSLALSGRSAQHSMTAAPRCRRIISSDGRSCTRDAQPPGHSGPSGQASPAMVVQRTAFSTAGTRMYRHQEVQIAVRGPSTLIRNLSDCREVSLAAQSICAAMCHPANARLSRQVRSAQFSSRLEVADRDGNLVWLPRCASKHVQVFAIPIAVGFHRLRHRHSLPVGIPG